MKKLKHEISIIKDLRHANIVTCYGFSMHESFAVLFLEFIQLQSLRDIIDKIKGFDLIMTQTCISQLAIALGKKYHPLKKMFFFICVFDCFLGC